MKCTIEGHTRGPHTPVADKVSHHGSSTVAVETIGTRCHSYGSHAASRHDHHGTRSEGGERGDSPHVVKVGEDNYRNYST